MNKIIVIRLGGSLLYTNSFNLNKDFLIKFKSLVIKSLEKNDFLFAFITGGGALTRSLMSQVSKINPKTKPFNKHYLGLKVTHVNKAILNAVLNADRIKPVESFSDGSAELLRGNNVIIAGESTGGTTDMTASEFANFVGVKDVYKLSNVEGVYDKDPNIFANANLFKVLSWNGYAQLFGLDLSANQIIKPGMHAPVDFKCAKYCLQNSIRFHLSGGKDFFQYEGQKFIDLWKKGTLITN